MCEWLFFRILEKGSLPKVLYNEFSKLTEQKNHSFPIFLKNYLRYPNKEILNCV